MKDPRLTYLEGQLRRSLPHIAPTSEMGQMIAKHGAERGLELAAIECLRRIEGIESARAKVRRGMR